MKTIFHNQRHPQYLSYNILGSRIERSKRGKCFDERVDPNMEGWTIKA